MGVNRLPRKAGRWTSRLICCAALTLGASVGHATVTLRVAAQEGTEPKFITAEHGAIVGLCIDIMRAIEQIDPSLKFVGDQQWMPLVRVYSETANGKQDAVCGVQDTQAREQLYVFLDPPLFPINYMLIARADDAAVINNWDDVRKLGKQGVLLANRGFASTSVLTELGGLQVDSSSASPAMNLQKLIAGRGRFFVHRTPGLQAFLDRNGAGKTAKILPQVMLTVKLRMAMGKHVAPETRLRVQHALEQLDKAGELDRLLKKWN